MARLTGALTQGLMNPTYGNQLSQAMGMLGGLGGEMRKERLGGERMEALRNAPDARARLELAIKQAKTSEELLAAQAALTEFDRQAKNDARTATLQQREDLVFAQGQADRDRTADNDAAVAMLGAAGMRYNSAVLAGEEEKAAQILKNMERTAARGQGLNVQDYIDSSLLDPETRAKLNGTSSASLAERYVKAGDGLIFDRQEAKFIKDPSEKEEEDAVELNPKDYLANIRQDQKNNSVFTEESYQEFLKAIPSEGVYAAADKHLKKTDIAKRKSDKRAGAMNNATQMLSNIDDLIERAPDMDPEGGFGNVAAGVGQSVASLVSGTAAGALEDDVKTIQAKEAFGALQTMRDNSKTGGALGNVSERELELLKADVATLNPAGATFKQNLQKVRNKYQRILEIEMGPPANWKEGDAGSYQKSPEGRWLYVDPVSSIVYDYESGDPDPRFN